MSTYGSGCGVVVVAKKIPCVRNKKDFEEERTALLMTQQNILKNQADRLFHYNCYRSNCYGTEVLASCTKNRFKCLTALVKSSGPRKCALSPQGRQHLTRVEVVTATVVTFFTNANFFSKEAFEVMLSF